MSNFQRECQVFAWLCGGLYNVHKKSMLSVTSILKELRGLWCMQHKVKQRLGVVYVNVPHSWFKDYVVEFFALFYVNFKIFPINVILVLNFLGKWFIAMGSNEIIVNHFGTKTKRTTFAFPFMVEGMSQYGSTESVGKDFILWVGCVPQERWVFF